MPRFLRGELQGRIDFIEAAGPSALPGSITPIGNEEEFFTLNVGRKGTGIIQPILCYGPFGENEITLLAGVPDAARGILRPIDALQLARVNRAELLTDPSRKIRERVT